MTMELDTILCGDSLNVLKALPESSVHCCVTSPPYYGLRDYGMDAQIGREATPEEYISRLTAVFREVRRVLRPDGTLWVNIADSYCGTGSKGDARDPKYPQGRNGQNISLCYNSSIGKSRIKMQTFRIIAKNPSHENAASKLVPAAVRFFVLAKFVRSKQHSALLYETAVLLFLAVINARMRDDIISSCRQRFSSFLLAALVRSKQRGTSLL